MYTYDLKIQRAGLELLTRHSEGISQEGGFLAMFQVKGTFNVPV